MSKGRRGISLSFQFHATVGAFRRLFPEAAFVSKYLMSDPFDLMSDPFDDAP